jgi:hypothetical protein
VAVGEVGIANGTAIGDGLGKARPERCGDERIAPDRHQRADHTRHQRADMDVAGHDNMAGTHPRGRRGDALAHAFGVDRKRRRAFEDTRARRFGHLRKPERVIERMNMKRAREMHGMEIVIAPEHLAHALGGPALHLGAEFLPVEL